MQAQRDAVDPARLENKSSQDCPKREDVGSAHPPVPPCSWQHHAGSGVRSGPCQPSGPLSPAREALLSKILFPAKKKKKTTPQLSGDHLPHPSSVRRTKQPAELLWLVGKSLVELQSPATSGPTDPTTKQRGAAQNQALAVKTGRFLCLPFPEL